MAKLDACILAGWLALSSALGVITPRAPQRVIFDTDMGNDVDDALALAVLHALESRGESRLLAVTVTKDEPYAAPYIDIVNTFYSRPDIPIGVTRSGITPEPNFVTTVAQMRDASGASLYPHDVLDGRRAPDATRVLRCVLAAQPDSSVVVIQTGFSTNLARLLDTPADDCSPLPGRDLAARKVSMLEVMAGRFDATDAQARDFLEYNVKVDVPSARAVFMRWPTPIEVSGFEVGAAVMYPAASIDRDFAYVAHHPIRDGYIHFAGARYPYDRPTWDVTSVLQGVRPTSGYFGLSVPGRVMVDERGHTTFRPEPNGPHRYLTVSANQVIRAREEIVRLASQRPGAEGGGQRAQPDLDLIDRTVRSQVDSGFSGVLLVAWRDSVLLHRAYAPPRERLSSDDAFWIASMTKGFTAAAVLRLQEEGRLGLRDSIGRFFADAPPDKRAVTIQQLLTHTSGLGGEYTGGGITERSAAVRAILAQPLMFPPGHGYKYGDDDYELLAAIIEIAAGESWEEYVRARLLVPLHLEKVGFACRPNDGTRVPVGRSERAQRLGTAFSQVTCDWGHKGANGMSASAEDLLTWSRALMVPGPLNTAGGGAIGEPQVFVRREPPFDISYGLGVRVYTLSGKVVEVMHSGSGDNDHTGIVRNLSTGLTIIVLSNAGQRAGTTWSSYVAQHLAMRG